MKHSIRIVSALSALALVGVAGSAIASRHIGLQMGPGAGSEFALQGQPVGGASAPVGSATASLQSSALAMFAGDTIVLDPDSGKLVRADHDGVKVATLNIGRRASQLVIDTQAARAYVADRDADRIVVVDLSSGLKQVDAFSTKAEPYALALTPDARTLLVTSVADKSLTGYDLASGLPSWSLEIGPEPRGVAISPSGDQALVTFLTTGVVGRVDLKPQHPVISYISIDPVQATVPSAGNSFANTQQAKTTTPASADKGRSFARNAFSAIFVGNDVAVVPHQLSTPQLADSGQFEGESSGYGGGSGFTAPVSHRFAFLALPDQGEQSSVRTSFAATNMHQPRAVAYDGASDTLYVAGFGSDEVMALGAVSQASIHMAWKAPIRGGDACGPSGLAFDEASGGLAVFCSLTRNVVRFDAPAQLGQAMAQGVVGAPLTSSHLSQSAQRGQEMFRRGRSTQMSTGGAMSCSSCHAEGRADSLTWSLAGNILQTPFLSGRVMGSHPFKWDGKDEDLHASLTNTVTRLGGSGISTSEAKDISAFLASMDKPRTPTADSSTEVARGKALFESDLTGCAECHNGPLLTDQNSYPMTADLPMVDTPSLIGLSNSAPYYHDGSAATLQAVLRGKGNIHGMGRISKLSEEQIGDLVSYMESL